MKDNISWVGCQPGLGGNREIGLFLQGRVLGRCVGVIGWVIGWVRLPAMGLG